MTNNFYWKIQQRELPAHLHRFTRGKWEEVDGGKNEKAVVGCVMTVNKPSLRFDIWGKSREAGTRRRRNGEIEIPHCSDPDIPPPTTTSIHPTQMLSKRVVSIAKGRTILTPQAFSRGL